MRDGPLDWIDPFAAYWRSGGGEGADPADARMRPEALLEDLAEAMDPPDEEWTGFEELFQADRRMRRLVGRWRRARLSDQ